MRVENDFLMRARHFKSKNNERISIFRALAHTSFISDNVIRLSRKDLDASA